MPLLPDGAACWKSSSLCNTVQSTARLCMGRLGAQPLLLTCSPVFVCPLQIQLQQSFTPGVTMQMLVKQRPDWDYWVQNFDSTATELMSRVPKGALWNLQLQPFAQVMMISPLRPEDVSQISPPRDLIGGAGCIRTEANNHELALPLKHAQAIHKGNDPDGEVSNRTPQLMTCHGGYGLPVSSYCNVACVADPTRRDGIMNIIQTREPGVNGPFYLVQGFTGAFVRYPIYVPNVSETETFGFHYKENATAIPYSELPASVRSCTICYNATTREKW